MACTKTTIISLFTCSIIFLILTISLVIVWPSLFFKILKNQLILTNSSKSFEMWRETPIPMYLEIYLYNFTNAHEVLENPKLKPHYVEMGPYVYREHHSKVNLTWHENSTISFLQKRTWWFEPSMTNGSLSDKITNINVVALTAAHFGKNLPIYLRLALDAALRLKEDSVIVTTTVEEILFKGYDDKLIDLIKELNIIEMPYDKFGWFYGRNLSSTFDGWMNMHTGADDSDMLGILDMWNFNKRIPFYNDDCGKVKGGTGELFPPQYEPDNVTVFATDICSSVTLKRTGDITVEGITGSLFGGDETVFDNGWNHPEEKCYCIEKQHCGHYGARDVSKCKLGAPAYISFPHFYLADPYYLSKLDGITPNKERDEFQMGLEVYTGIPLYVRAQLQINLYHERVTGITFLNKLPDKTYYPMLWFRQEVTLTNEYANQARIALLVPDIVQYILYAGIAICLLIFFIAFINNVRRNRSEESRVLIEVTDN